MEGLAGYLEAMTEGSLNSKVGHWLTITDQKGNNYGPLMLTGFLSDANGRRKASFSDGTGGNTELLLTEISSIAESAAPAAAVQTVQTVVYEAPWSYPVTPFIYGGGRGGGHRRHHGHHGIGQDPAVTGSATARSQNPYVVPIFSGDPGVIAMYRDGGWMVIPVSEALAMAERTSAVYGIGSFWSGLWGGIAWPFKTVWKGASWLAVQPIHGVKWAWNQAKNQYEMVQAEGGNLPTTETPPSTTAGIGISTPLMIAGGALALWLLYVTWKRKPLVPKAISSRIPIH